MVTVDSRLSRTCARVSVCSRKVDLVVVMDSSGSINERDFSRVLNFVRELIGRLNIDSGLARVGLVIFADEPHSIFSLDTYSSLQVTIRLLRWLRTSLQTRAKESYNNIEAAEVNVVYLSLPRSLWRKRSKFQLKN